MIDTSPWRDDQFRTVGEAIAWVTSRFDEAGLSYGHGTDNASDEAAYLVAETVGIATQNLGATLGEEAAVEARREIVRLVEARIAERKPTAYLVGKAYIGGFGFRADERALIPRSLIGELLAAAIAADQGLPFLQTQPNRILELGTGSGSLAILAALAFPQANVDAVDVSADALALARENVADYRLQDRVRLFEGDLYSSAAAARYDLIISNPPYVDRRSMASLPAEYQHEPSIALAGGEDGLDIVRRIVAGAEAHLNKGGGLLCEIGAGQHRLVESFPTAEFVWLDTATTEGEVFWLPAKA